VLGQPIWNVAVVIGVVTAALSLGAAQLGSRVRLRSTRRAGVLGGARLFAPGCSILVKHLSGG